MPPGINPNILTYVHNNEDLKSLLINLQTPRLGGRDLETLGCSVPNAARALLKGPEGV